MEELFVSNTRRIKKVQRADIDSSIKKDGIHINPLVTTYTRIKYPLEFFVVLVSLVILAPVFLLIALLIKLDSRGNILFKQQRLGISGKPFTMYKFRSMVNGAHQMQNQIMHLNEMNGGKLFKSDKDPRITKLGRFLRKTSIDELPQLFNIIIGDMSIIGPRPLSTPLEDYKQADLVRFRVRPGLGCIWQAYFRRETDFKNWMYTDGIYVKNISLKLDVKLLYIIIKNVFSGKGAR